jgi:arginase
VRRIAVLDAPTNLGLRPPTATSVPGCAKAPGALRDHGLVARLDAHDAGCVTPPRYDPGDWRPGDGVAHAEQIAWYSRRLADRIGALLDGGEFPVVLGGDCSVLLGSALAVRRRADRVGGRIGLVFVDGHSDFRHPGNASYVGAAAGEDLALATGRGQSDLAAIENRRPYFRDSDVVVLGIRSHDEHRMDLQAAGIAVRGVPQLRVEGAGRSAHWARRLLSGCVGYWVHVDVDVLDPAVMPAVDAPDAGGIAYAELEQLIVGLVSSPQCVGVEITVFDPDYDPTGAYAAEMVDVLVAGLAPAATVASLDWSALAAAAEPVAANPPFPAPIAQPVAESDAELPAERKRGAGREPVAEATPELQSEPEPAPEQPPPAGQIPEPKPEPVAHSAVATAPGPVPVPDRAPRRAAGLRRDPPGESAAPAGGLRPSAVVEPAGTGDLGWTAATIEPAAPAGSAAAPEPAPHRPAAPTQWTAGWGRSGLDRLNFSDMADADRVALTRRGGGASLRRRDQPAETDQPRSSVDPTNVEPAARPQPAEVTPAARPQPAEVTPAARPQPAEATQPADVAPASGRQPAEGDPGRPYAGLADQIRAAGSGQAPVNSEECPWI